MYDTALAALATSAPARARHAAPLALAAAEAELGCCGGAMQQGPGSHHDLNLNSEGGPTGDAAAARRALHLLAWLASGGPYERPRLGAKGALPALPDAARSRPLCWCGEYTEVYVRDVSHYWPS